MLRVIAISVLLVGLVPGVARGAVWQWPVSGRIVGAFSFSPMDPYAAGQRRGIVMAARPGRVVRAACPGRVAFAGAVGRAGPTVSVQCGALRATYQGIVALSVAEAAFVRAGSALARVGERGELRLGVRTASGGYVDPAHLLADRAPPLGPAPRTHRPRPPAAGRPREPAPPAARPRVPARPADQLRSPVRPPAPVRVSPRAMPDGPPVLAWVGLAALLTAMPLGALARGRTGRRRAEPARVAAPVLGTGRK